jgi:hypothetical protein
MIRSTIREIRRGVPAARPTMLVPNRVGGGLAAPVLPHHRAYGSVHGGFFYEFNTAYLSERLTRPRVLNQVLLIA